MTQQYLEAVRTVMHEGTRKPNRTYVDTISAFDVPMRFDMRWSDEAACRTPSRRRKR
jgi:thymidylate synthase